MSDYELFLRKSRVLLSEALEDFKIKCFNKCTSALWFSIEGLLKAIILQLKGSYPRRIGNLINIISKELQNRNFDKIIIKYIREIYNDRKNADHGILLIDEKRCKENLKKGKRVISSLIKLFNIKDYKVDSFDLE